MSTNRTRLISELESLQELEGRYESLKCVNYDSANGKTRGCFSLVFRAYDRVEQKEVAIKFYDVDPANLVNDYRIRAFEREPQILQQLLGKKRCLQLVNGVNTYVLRVKDAHGTVVAEIPCKYFAVEWIETEVDQYFDDQHSHTAEEKLKLFNDIVLAVEALHRHEVHHRDLKVDNLRSYEEALGRLVVAIDLGTAARCNMDHLQIDYARSVGAPWYAAPEALSGFAGDRALGHKTDVYALGCLLYELFNPDYFGFVARKSGVYESVLAALALRVIMAPPEQKRSKLDRALAALGHAVPSIPADGPGSTVPVAIATRINALVAGMTAFDHRNRNIDLAQIRQIVWSAIKCLQSARAEQRRVEAMRVQRRRRADKLRNRDERLQMYLRQRGGQHA